MNYIQVFGPGASVHLVGRAARRVRDSRTKKNRKTTYHVDDRHHRVHLRRRRPRIVLLVNERRLRRSAPDCCNRRIVCARPTILQRRRRRWHQRLLDRARIHCCRARPVHRILLIKRPEQSLDAAPLGRRLLRYRVVDLILHTLPEESVSVARRVHHHLAIRGRAQATCRRA